MNDTQTELEPDIRIVKIDESGFWSDPELIEEAEKIFGVYLYDANRHVNCCELTPSYELHFIESQPLQTVLDDGQREKMHERIQEGDSETDAIRCIHVKSIDAMQEVDEVRGSRLSHRFKLSHLEGSNWGSTDFDEVTDKCI